MDLDFNDASVPPPLGPPSWYPAAFFMIEIWDDAETEWRLVPDKAFSNPGEAQVWAAKHLQGHVVRAVSISATAIPATMSVDLRHPRP